VQLVELQRRLGELKEQGLGLAVITYDSPAILADFSRRRDITFPLLSDPDSETIKAYGILNTTVAVGTPTFGIPFPGTFVVDRTGKVLSRFFEEAYQERNTVSTIMLALDRAKPPAAAKRIETDHLEITSYMSDDIVAPGSLFSVVFDVKPHAGIHVYAPGATSYRIINFRIEPNPILEARPLHYPASEIYYFKPLDERVPVFQKPFRLVQRLVVSTSPDARAALKGIETISIAGSLEYQACDDRLCFTPRSIPVSHTVKLRQLDTERAAVPK
jgi:peroxiredoxin